MRVSIGTDIHRLGAGVSIRVAGLYFPDEPFGLSGHSDDGMTTHTIVDTPLASAGLRDIGSNFGTDRPEWKDIPGIAFLTGAARPLRTVGFRICSVNAQAIGNRSRMAACRGEAERILSEVIGAPVPVSVTTMDGLGLAGHREGVAAITVAMTTVD